MSRGIELHEPIKRMQRTTIFAIESMERSFDKIYNRFPGPFFFFLCSLQRSLRYLHREITSSAQACPSALLRRLEEESPAPSGVKL